MIAKNLQQVRARIGNACRLYKRATKEITLVAVSKKQPNQVIKEAILEGVTHFGENYLQEALPKGEALSAEQIKWHFIGSIQSNKAKKIAEHFDWVHTVDRESIAVILNAERPNFLSALNVCVEVNISEQHTKSGLSVVEIESFLPIFSHLKRLRLRGLMVIPKYTTNLEEQNKIYQQVQNVYNKLRGQGWSLDTLSMGMSHDFEVAIKHGATMLRVGQAIFGRRDT